MAGLDGKTALITGAGGGIGSAFMRALVGEGMSVAATDFDLGRAQAADEHRVFTPADWKNRIRAVYDERIAAFGESAVPELVEPFAALDKTLSKHPERPEPAAAQD